MARGDRTDRTDRSDTSAYSAGGSVLMRGTVEYDIAKKGGGASGGAGKKDKDTS